jgi:CRP-like cAMP-binding protein
LVGPTPERRQILRRSALFARLPDDEIDKMFEHAVIRRYAADAQIFYKGDLGSSMMAVLWGRVVIRAPSSDGKEVILNIINEGEIFGEIALLDGKERTADATAMTDCELLVIARRSFLPLLERPDMMRELLNVLCERLRRTSEQVEDVLFLDVAARIAKTLLRFAKSRRCLGAERAHCSRPVAARNRQSYWRVTRKSEQEAASVATRRDHYR